MNSRHQLLLRYTNERRGRDQHPLLFAFEQAEACGLVTEALDCIGRVGGSFWSFPREGGSFARLAPSLG